MFALKSLNSQALTKQFFFFKFADENLFSDYTLKMDRFGCRFTITPLLPFPVISCSITPSPQYVEEENGIDARRSESGLFPLSILWHIVMKIERRRKPLYLQQRFSQWHIVCNQHLTNTDSTSLRRHHLWFDVDSKLWAWGHIYKAT